MGIEERSATWTGSKREFRQPSSRGGTKIWSIQVEGPNIVTAWGLLGGKIQTVTETQQAINVGKSNEKSGAQYAIERARETVRKKGREGYAEYIDGEPADVAKLLSINFDAPLPDELCFYKPKNEVSKELQKKIDSGEAWFSRKMNGLMYLIVKGSGGTRPRLYSRRMLRQHHLEVGTDFTWNDRYPHIIEAADRVMPENSILLGELVALKNGVEQGLQAISSYEKNLTPEAIELNKKDPASFYIWDVAFWGGKNLVCEATVRERYDLIHELEFKGNALIPVQYWTGAQLRSEAEALDWAKSQKFEGFVVVDPNGVYGEDGFNFKGKPDRPGHACGKLKPTFEDDFIVKWDPDKDIGERSTKGRYGQGIKCVALYQYNSNGELIYISNLSSGMTEGMKRDWAKTALYPQVWKVEYKDRRYASAGDDSNALDFAAFIEVRTDKRPEECVNPSL